MPQCGGHRTHPFAPDDAEHDDRRAGGNGEGGTTFTRHCDPVASLETARMLLDEVMWAVAGQTQRMVRVSHTGGESIPSFHGSTQLVFLSSSPMAPHAVN